MSLTLGVTLMALSLAPASAASAKTGEITGRVSECGPGPIVASPDPVSPHPIAVRLMHEGTLFRSENITLPQQMPWIGTFLFNVPAGRYEVVKTYQTQARWVTVSAGAKSVVTFGLVACPD